MKLNSSTSSMKYPIEINYKNNNTKTRGVSEKKHRAYRANQKTPKMAKNRKI